VEFVNGFCGSEWKELASWISNPSGVCTDVIEAPPRSLAFTPRGPRSTTPNPYASPGPGAIR
jgi:hypothetical protein